MKKQNKKHQIAKSISEKLKTKRLMFFVSFFHVTCKISNFDMWTAKHLAKASCTELTLLPTYLSLSTYLKKDPLALYSLYEQVCIEMAFYPEDQTSGLYVSPIKTLGPYKAISLAKAQMTTVVVSISFYSY